MAEKEKKEVKDEKNYTQIAIVIIIVAAIAGGYLFITTRLTQASFSTFKSGFNSAPRVAIVASYSNATQYNAEAVCFTTMVQVISHSRNPSTIDFYIISNDTCTYSPNGLGHVINPVNTTAATCLRSASTEPSIFLNYTSFNNTVVMANKLLIQGNAQYYSKCPIAVDLS